MATYVVTYCTMDQELGANPFWHTCILLSKLDEETKKLEVIETWGYYGLPTTNGDSWMRSLKIMVGLDVDLYGNHGMLRHEEMRYLDLGVGLHGASFEVSEEKFLALQAKCRKMDEEQKAAIKDAVEPFGLKGKPRPRIYAHEHLSTNILALEEAASKEQKRASRLKPFSFSFFNPYTCKMQAINLLDGILTPEQIRRVRGYHQAVSRWSGPMENIYLHSSGPIREHKKASGEVVHYRDIADEGVKLHWTMPPQEIETLSGEVRNLFKINDEYNDEVKTVVRRLQQLEWLFRNAVFESDDFARRDQLISEIRRLYEAFARIEPRESRAGHYSWDDTWLWLMGQPRDDQEEYLRQHLAEAKSLFNALYMMTVDDVSDAEDEEVCADVVTLAARLQPAARERLCSIIGRTYIDPEEDQDDSLALAM